MSALEIHQFPCLSDNYGVLIHDTANNLTASIDAPDAGTVRAALAARNWNLTHILVTHHHADHTGGIAELKAETGCHVIGPRNEAGKIPTLDEQVAEGDHVKFGGFEILVFDTPGHTLGHVSYYIPDAKVAFVGDTMFAMGCGRLFEGDARMMWDSLSKLIALPDDTTIYCGHEYTLSNGRFASSLEPNNRELKERMVRVEAARERGEPTLPTTLALEKATSPFLRARDPELRAFLGLEDAEDWEVFAEVRRRKDKA